MLNHELCLRCYMEYFKDTPYFILAKKEMRIGFMEAWKAFECLCPMKDIRHPTKNIRLNIKSKPPKSCPYILEHLVSKSY